MNNFSPESLLIEKDESHRGVEINRRKIKTNEDRENRENLSVAQAKAAELLEGERIDPEKFKGLYSERVIKEDQEYIKQRQQKFGNNDDRKHKELSGYAMVFEAIVHDQIDMNGWLGENATAQKASWYDDLKNGIDEIIEFEGTETAATSQIALGVDVTFGKGVIDKLNGIKSRIDAGDMGVIKYLLTDTYRGEMRNVPRAVIGADMKNLNEIIKLWVDGKKKDLAQHQIKFMILSQIMIQLNDFSEYAEKIGQAKIADGFRRVQKVVENIWDEESKKSAEMDFNFEDDRVYSAIRSYCDDLNK